MLYIGLITSVLYYGCMVYELASKTLLKKQDQYHALNVCCGAKKTTPVSALRREKISVVYWAHLGDMEKTSSSIYFKTMPRELKKKGRQFWMDN